MDASDDEPEDEEVSYDLPSWLILLLFVGLVGDVWRRLGGDGSLRRFFSFSALAALAMASSAVSAATSCLRAVSSGRSCSGVGGGRAGAGSAGGACSWVGAWSRRGRAGGCWAGAGASASSWATGAVLARRGRPLLLTTCLGVVFGFLSLLAMTLESRVGEPCW